MTSSTDRKRKRNDRSMGAQGWAARAVNGPGVWVSCVKGKEKQTVGELYDLFESIGSELWPEEDKTTDIHDSDGDGEPEENLESQIAKELASIKRPRKEKRFVNGATNTPCGAHIGHLIFIACSPPVDPVKLVTTHVQNVSRTGVTRTRYTHRLVPVSDSCVANISEIQGLCKGIFASFFSSHPDKKFKYKIELRIRNHNTLSRPTIIEEIARCVPEGHIVDLEDPEMFILVEVFKSICGVSVVQDYYSLLKFNVMEIANSMNIEKQFGENAGRMHEKTGEASD